jgi:hypothetical protein
MVWFALGIGVLALLMGLLRAFATAPVESVRKVLVWSLAGLGGGLLMLLLLSGRGGQAFWSLALFGPAALRWWRGRRASQRFASPAPEAEGESTVLTATLEMRLDHASGQMQGRVRQGRFTGQDLAALGLPELLALLAECRAGDPESLPLLEAWLDRLAPDWREAEAAAPGAAPPGPGGPMGRAEALAVLGLAEGAGEDEIRGAHRRLMRAAHPDHGGSDWLATRINQARDRLLEG